VQWDNLNQPVTVDDNITFGQILLMLFIDCVIYLVVMWYVEAVFPGPYGIKQPPYFFVLVSHLIQSRLLPTFMFLHFYFGLKRRESYSCLLL